MGVTHNFLEWVNIYGWDRFSIFDKPCIIYDQDKYEQYEQTIQLLTL